MFLNLIISSLLVAFNLVCSMDVVNVLTTEDKQKILDAHNEYRSITALGNTTNQPPGSNINFLFWDDGLASVAANWAKNCTFSINPNKNSQIKSYNTSFVQPSSIGVGQNTCALGDDLIMNVSRLMDCIETWYNQSAIYTYTAEPTDDVSYYLQLVYDATRYVGCGYYTCNSGITNTGFSTTATILICNYFPTYYYGNYPYTNGSYCSDCDNDRTSCVDGLCGGCMSSSYVKNGSTKIDDCNNGLGVNVSNVGDPITLEPTLQPTRNPSLQPSNYPTSVPIKYTYFPTQKPIAKPTTSSNHTASSTGIKHIPTVFLSAFLAFLLSLLI